MQALVIEFPTRPRLKPHPLLAERHPTHASLLAHLGACARWFLLADGRALRWEMKDTLAGLKEPGPIAKKWRAAAKILLQELDSATEALREYDEDHYTAPGPEHDDDRGEVGL